MTTKDFISIERTLKSRWAETQIEIAQTCGSAPMSVSCLLQRTELQRRYINESAPLVADLPTVCAWNVMTVARYLEKVYSPERVKEILGTLRNPSFEEILKNQHQFVPLQTFLDVMGPALAMSSHSQAAEAHTIGASATNSGSFGPIKDLELYLKSQFQVSLGSLFFGPVASSITIAVEKSRSFNTTKDSVLWKEGPESYVLIHWYRPWIDLVADWYSYMFTNGHFAGLPELFGQPPAVIDDLCYQWDPVSILQLHGYKDAHCNRQGEVICLGNVVAEPAPFYGVEQMGQQVILPSSREFPSMPLYLPNGTNTNQQWLGWVGVENFPLHNPIISKGVGYGAPFGASRYCFKEVPVAKRLQRMGNARIEISRRRREVRDTQMFAISEQIIHEQADLNRELVDAVAEEEAKRRIAEDKLLQEEEHLGRIAHDIGNPLTVIKTGIQTALIFMQDSEFAENLEKRLPVLLEILEEAEKDSEFIDYMRLAIVERVRALRGDHTPLELGETSLKNIVERGTRYQKPRFKANRNIVVESEEVKFLGDSNKLVTVLMNLVGNALKYSSGKVLITSQILDGKLLLSIADQGTILPGSEIPKGLTLEESGRLFQAFFTRLENRAGVEGTGIGLMSVLSIIEAHGGVIYIEGWEDGTPGSSLYRSLETGCPTLLPEHGGEYLTAFRIVLPLDGPDQK